MCVLYVTLEMPQNDMMNNMPPDSESDVAVLPRLSSVYDLIRYGIKSVLARLDLLFLPLIPTLSSVGLAAAMEHFSAHGSLTVLLSVSLFVMTLAQVIMLFAVLYIATHEGQPTFREAFHFLRRNIVSFTVVLTLVTLASLGGMIFFVIPGLVATFVLYFSQYAFMIHGKRGMDALMYSRSLIIGRFWEVLLKVIGLIVYALCVVGVLMLIFGLSFGPETIKRLSEHAYISGAEVLAALIFAVVEIAISIIAFFVFARLYRELIATRPDPQPATKQVRIWYWFLIGVGTLFLLGLVLAVVFFRDEIMRDAATGFTSAHQAELSAAPQLAADYALAHNGSFEDVCTILTPAFGSEAACNDDAAGWALQVIDNGTSWCVDTDTPPKRIATALKTRTHCLALP